MVNSKLRPRKCGKRYIIYDEVNKQSLNISFCCYESCITFIAGMLYACNQECCITTFSEGLKLVDEAKQEIELENKRYVN